MTLSIVILAAGQGTRMNSEQPKVLQPLAGRALLAHVIETARALDADAINVVYGYGGDAVRDAFPDEDLTWTLQAEQLGTGHAVAQALPAVPADHQVLVLCGDAPLLAVETLAILCEVVAPDSFGLLTATLEDPSGYGRIVRNTDGDVVGIVEESDATDEQCAIDEINTGVMLMPAGWLARVLTELKPDNAQGEYYLTDVIARAVDERLPIVTVEAPDANEVLGINDRAQLAAAERVVQQRYAQRLLDQGATLADPARIEQRGDVTIGKDVFIDVGAVLIGRVVLGDRVRVGPYAVIENSTLGDDCTVHPHCVMSGATMGPGCEIGPFARLRPGATFIERVKIGNFVEIKASEIEAGSKVNHLSYVGDTHVGTGVNIGAGTITCNYDGANKHRTTIGDNVFVGSGVMLVAPIVVGDGATIGAGATLSRDVAADALTVARTRPTTIPGWRRPEKKPRD